MSSIKKIDAIDALIIKELLEDGRKELIEIANEARVSKDVIWQHYIKMKRDGIIVGATIQLNYEALGYNVAASFFVDVPPKQQDLVIEQLRKIPGLYDAYPWGGHTRLWAVADFMKADQIDRVKQLIRKMPLVLRLEVEIWTGVKRMPENLSVLIEALPSNADSKTKRQSKENTKLAKEIDNIDKQIIEKLALNGRATFSDIGKQLEISTSTIARRYDVLERKGIIKPLIQVNPEKIGYPVAACFRLMIDSDGDLSLVAEKMARIPDVVGIVKTTGVYDLTVFAQIRDIEHFIALETAVSNIDGIKEMERAGFTKFNLLPYPREHVSTF